MKNIYVIYGKPMSGKSHFVRNFIYNEKTDLYEYSEINEFNFINKFADIDNYYKYFNNLIIDDIISDKVPENIVIPGDKEYPEDITISVNKDHIANSHQFAHDLLKVEKCFDNLILICHEPSDVSKLVARMEALVDNKVEVKYIKIEKNLEVNGL